jgi:hypothetical protein
MEPGQATQELTIAASTPRLGCVARKNIDAEV